MAISADFTLSRPHIPLEGLEGSNNHSGVSVTHLSCGGYFVVWGRQDATDGEGYGIRGRMFTAGRSAMAADVLLNATGPRGVQQDPEGVGLSDGRILITWSVAPLI